jgi:hypothetical protein
LFAIAPTFCKNGPAIAVFSFAVAVALAFVCVAPVFSRFLALSNAKGCDPDDFDREDRQLWRLTCVSPSCCLP